MPSLRDILHLIVHGHRPDWTWLGYARHCLVCDQGSPFAFRPFVHGVATAGRVL